jgi:hypothetical protein
MIKKIIKRVVSSIDPTWILDEQKMYEAISKSFPNIQKKGEVIKIKKSSFEIITSVLLKNKKTIEIIIELKSPKIFLIINEKKTVVGTDNGYHLSNPTTMRWG